MKVYLKNARLPKQISQRITFMARFPSFLFLNFTIPVTVKGVDGPRSRADIGHDHIFLLSPYLILKDVQGQDE